MKLYKRLREKTDKEKCVKEGRHVISKTQMRKKKIIVSRKEFRNAGVFVAVEKQIAEKRSRPHPQKESKKTVSRRKSEDANWGFGSLY